MCALYLVFDIYSYIWYNLASGTDTLNIALGKLAYQSSTYETYPASLAVDGVLEENYSHTVEQSSQWWKVDLGEVYYVYRVRLWNRERYGEYKI